MTLISTGIDKVRAIALAAGVDAGGESVEEPLFVFVRWSSEHDDKLYRVYVNGQPAGATKDTKTREIVISFGLSQYDAARIEVYAVEPDEGDIDYSPEAGGLPESNRVEIDWPRQMSLPFEGSAKVYGNNGNGEVDYDQAVTKEDIQLWPGWLDKGGFGLSGFARSDFGFDGGAAVGFAKGNFGEGEHGFDTDDTVWISSELKTGIYQFGVKVTDRLGNSSEASESRQAVVIEEAVPAGRIEVKSYDKTKNEFVLEVS